MVHRLQRLHSIVSTLGEGVVRMLLGEQIDMTGKDVRDARKHNEGGSWESAPVTQITRDV